MTWVVALLDCSWSVPGAGVQECWEGEEGEEGRRGRMRGGRGEEEKGGRMRGEGEE